MKRPLLNDLRRTAKERAIPGYAAMSREDLIRALAEADAQAAAAQTPRWSVALDRVLSDDEAAVVTTLAAVRSTLVFEAADEWELHEVVSDLNDELASMGSTLHIPRPARVDTQSPGVSY